MYKYQGFFLNNRAQNNYTQGDKQKNKYVYETGKWNVFNNIFPFYKHSEKESLLL